MRTTIHLNAAALRQNYRIFVKLANNMVVAPVLKSNAYGHGFDEIYQCLKSEHPKVIAVNYIYEARRLRTLGYTAEILVVGPTYANEINEALDIDAQITVGDQIALDHWLCSNAKPKIHLKFDTGMGRQGFFPDDAGRVAEMLLDFKDLVVGVASHFANVEDVSEHDYANLQKSKFDSVVETFRQIGFKFRSHIKSSASTLLIHDNSDNLARVGISLYGLWPSQATRLSYLQEHKELAELQPVLKWTTEIASIKEVPKGQYIGYGCTFRTVAPMTIGVLPIGYYEGFPRLAGEKGSYVLMRGTRCRVVGRVCMNMMMIDLSHIQKPKVGEEITIIGRDENEVIEAHMLASWAETIHYELLTRLNPEIPRVIELLS